MIAETMIGRGDEAHAHYLRINPSAREELSDIHRCEPYVYAQMIAGRDAPTHGEAKNSWLTGSASWNHVAISQWILGIRPTYEGLRISPVIPSAWNGFQAVRWFRGVRYEITARRKGKGNRVQLEVGGQLLPAEVIPIPAAGTNSVQVMVTLS
jgi:cellobiose phosphorylase